MRHDLLQPFDVAPGDRQHAELDAALERIGGEALPANQAQRVEQRAGEDRVGQRVRRRGEPGAIAIERRDRPPERFGRCGELRRDLLHQPRGAQLPHRLFGVPRPQNLVELLDQPRRRAARDLVAVRP